MDTSKLYQGQVVKNYKTLCEILGVKPKNGKSKILQVEDWKRYFKFQKQGIKYIINEVYHEPKDKVDLRCTIINNKQFNVPIEHHESMIVYRIVLGNVIYIGATTQPKIRFSEHWNNKHDYHKQTSELLQQGATFEFIKAFDNEQLMLAFEKQLIKQYSLDTNWECLNKDSNPNSFIPKPRRLFK